MNRRNIEFLIRWNDACERRRNMIRVKSRNDDFFLLKSLVKCWRTFTRRCENSAHIKFFFTVVSFFDAEGSVHGSMDSAVRILGRQSVDVCVTFEVEESLDPQGLGKVKYETLDYFLKEDR